MLYDKYFRKHIFEYFEDKTIFEIKEGKEYVKSNLINIGSFKPYTIEDKIQLLRANKNKTFEEILCLEHYFFIHKERTFSIFLISSFLLQAFLYKFLDKMQFKKKSFIFIDNNRLLHNHFMNGYCNLILLMKFNTYILGCVSLFYLGKFLLHRYMYFLNQEDSIETRNKRSVLIYNQLKNKV
jgi:hypothetical protein